MPERLPSLEMDRSGVVVRAELISDVDTIHIVVVGVDKAWDFYLFSDLVTEDSSGYTRISSNCSRAVAED